MNNQSFIKITLLLLILSFSVNLFSQITKEIALKEFVKINLIGASSYVLIPSDVNKLEVEVEDEDVMNYIKIVNEKNRLLINTTSKNKNISKLCSKLIFRIYFKEINMVSFEGSGHLESEKQIETNLFKVSLKGQGSIKLNIKCSSFKGSVNGTGSLMLKGSCVNSELDLAGVGNIKATKFITENTKVTVSGVGSAKVYASEKLAANLNGVGSIKYLGEPKRKIFDKNGLGSIKELGE